MVAAWVLIRAQIVLRVVSVLEYIELRVLLDARLHTFVRVLLRDIERLFGAISR